MSDVSAAASAPAAAVPGRSAWHDHSGFGFRDILDIINPLQHLPVVSSIYRWLTGDRPGEAAQVAGDALYGGPIGVAVSLVGAVFQDDQGHDAGERLLAAVFDKDKSQGDPPAVVADGAPAPPAAADAAASARANVQPAPSQASAQVPAQAPATPPAAVVLDHAPMPLVRPVGGSAVKDPAKLFLEHKATLDRQIGGPAAAAQGSPVPLIPPAGSLPAGRVSGAPVAPGASSAPVDISQRMLDALDKYMRLEKERKAAPTPPSVDYTM